MNGRQILAPNTLLHERYLIMNPLGQGGMGAVYQATDQKFGNAVAIKETLYSDHQLQGAFSQEAKLLNHLRHAALPVVMDYFAVEERQFLVMQYIPGKDLEDCLKERKAEGKGLFPASQVMQWADQLLDALEYLHSQNPPIIHRDIKPQNMRLTPRGEIILLDFGLAKGLSTQDSKSSKSIRGYTPSYASIEQIRGAETDARSDIYSIGATLYHLLTGELPPDSLTRIAAMLLGQPDPLQPITDLNPEVPQSLAAVIDKAVSPHPDQRFDSASLMRQTLRNAQENSANVGFHREPTLIDDPLFCTIEASMAVAIDNQLNCSGGSLPSSSGTHPQMVSRKPDQDSIVSEADKQDTSGHLAQEKARLQPAVDSSRSMLQARGFVVVCLALILASAGIVFLRFQKWGNGLIASINKLAVTTQATADGPAMAIPMRREALRYYLEIAPGSDDPARVAGLMPLSKGSRFKFHFTSRESGYLYIIALGGPDIWQTFLTNQPMPASGVITNHLDAGREFQFPDGGQWFMMHREAETTPFTVIFSPSPLSSPAFLTTQSGHHLNQNDAQELDMFRKYNADHSPDLVAVADDNQPAVTVQVPADFPSNAILIFDISLKKKQVKK